jgi:ribonuclease HII
VDWGAFFVKNSLHSAQALHHPLDISRQLWNFEKDLAGTVEVFAGVDEAGRGALAGPVVASAVILGGEPGQWQGIDDSKRISRKKRVLLHDWIMQQAKAVGVGIATVAEIDAFNILHASRVAMGRAIQNMNTHVSLVLVDGTFNPIFVSEPIPSIPVVQGDAKCLSVAAASIVAKVVRDNLMHDLGGKYPQYNFEQHVGYGTKQHLEALATYGPSEIHRTSFGPVQMCMQVRLDLS